MLDFGSQSASELASCCLLTCYLRGTGKVRIHRRSLVRSTVQEFVSFRMALKP